VDHDEEHQFSEQKKVKYSPQGRKGHDLFTDFKIAGNELKRHSASWQSQQNKNRMHSKKKL